MSKRIILIILFVGLLYYLFLIANQRNSQHVITPTTPKAAAIPTAPASTPQTISGDTKQVTRVIDGDTIVVEGNEKIRYIGINTPEKFQCYFQESTDENRRLVEGKNVTLQYDVSRFDKYGRTLAYLYVDNIFVNDKLVLEGYAKVETVPPDIKYAQMFVNDQKLARLKNKGLWDINKCQNS